MSHPQVRRKSLRLLIALSYIFTNVLFTGDFVQRAWASPSSPTANQNDFWSSRSLASSLTSIPPPLSAVVSPRAGHAIAATRDSATSPLDRISSFVTLRSAHAHSGPRTVIVIQDVHMNVEAQKNIGAALTTLLDQDGSAVVGAEAAAGDFDFRSFRRFPDAAASRNIADALLASKKISAVSWAGLTASRPEGRIVGVDDEALYRANLEAFRRATADGQGARSGLDQLISSLDARKAELPAALAGLHDAAVSYRKGTLPVAGFVRTLSAIVPADRYPQVALLRDALALEAHVDTTAARAERDRLVEKIGRLPKGLTSLAALAQQQSAHPLDTAAFHARLLTLARENGVDLTAYPSFEGFVRYLALANGIDQEKLFAELRAMTRDAARRAARNAGDLALFDRLQNARLAERLVSFELTPDEWTEYAAGRSSLPAPVASALTPFEHFFQAAAARDAAIAGRLEREMDRANASVGILVAGGFHAPGIQRFFDERGASVALVTPRLGAVDPAQGSAYLKAFLQERAPLADLFHSEKLTLADAAQLLGARPLAGRSTDEARNALGLLQAYAAGLDRVVTGKESLSVASTLNVPSVTITPRELGSVSVAVGDSTVDIGPSVAPTEGEFRNVLGQKVVGVQLRGEWLQRNGRRLASVAASLGAVFLTGADGGSSFVMLGIGAAAALVVGAVVIMVRALSPRGMNNARLPDSHWWNWIFTMFPVRIIVNGTGRTGIPNIVIALHTPGYRLVAVNGLENNRDGTEKLEEAAALLEHDEVLGDYGAYRVRVKAAGRAWIDANGDLHLTRNERPDGRQWAGSSERSTGVFSYFRFLLDRLYARRLMGRLDRRQPDWRKVWATAELPDGQARVEWLDIEANGKVHRVLFFNARGERTPHLPARALNVVGLSETSGAVLERKKLVPFFEGSHGYQGAAGTGTGVQVAVLGAPPKNAADKIPLHVMGVNHDRLSRLVDVVLSNCSCTTNGGVPLLYALAAVTDWIGEERIRLVRGYLTTTHGPTVSDQETVDVPKDSKKSGPASGSQTIPSTTGFLDVARPVLESAGVPLEGISAIAYRVPANPSEVGLAVDVAGKLSIAKALKIYIIAAGVADPQTISALMRGVNEARALRGEPAVPVEDVLLSPVEAAAARRSPMKGILGVIADNESHSTEFTQSNYSTVINLAHLSVRWDEATDETRVDLYSWYSNEWGYSMRTLESLRAFALRYWHLKGLRAFFDHLIMGRLPAPDDLKVPEGKKDDKAKKSAGASRIEISQLPDFITGPTDAPRPTASLVIDATDKVQVNRALVYVWNFLRGDRRVDLRAIVGFPSNPDLLASFSKMLKKPTGYDPLPGRWSVVMPESSDASGPNSKAYPVLRYYGTLDAASPAVEIAMLPAADASAASAVPVTHTLVLTHNLPTALATNGTRIVMGPDSADAAIVVPANQASTLPIGQPVQAMGGRALAAYHLTAPLTNLPDNRVSQLSVKEIVFARGEKPILPRLRGRRLEGNTQMESLSSRVQLARAFASAGIPVAFGGQTDVVNNQNGSIVQITATLGQPVTADDVKAAVKEYARRMSALGFRVVALSGKEQMFAADAFAGRPAIFISLDSIDVGDGRLVTMSAWFDDRLADVNSLNEVAAHDFAVNPLTPVIAPGDPVSKPTLTDSAFRNGASAATVAPVVEEVSTRFFPLTLAPVISLFLLAPGAAWLSLGALPLTIGVFSAAVVASIVLHAIIHVFVDGRNFFSRLPHRFARSSAYVGGYLRAASPALLVLVPLAVFDMAMGGTSFAVPALMGAIQGAVVVLAGLLGLNRTIADHAAHNRLQLQRQAVEKFLRSPRATDGDKAAAIEFLHAQGLETLGLAQWTRSQPGLSARSPWTAYDAVIDSSLEVAHFDLDDLLTADADPLLGQTDAFHRTLQQVAALSEKNAVIVTASPSLTPDEARGRLQTLLRSRGIELPHGAALSGVAFDLSARADPFAVAGRFKALLGGRRLHAMPFQGASLANWDLGAFLTNSSDKAEVLIEIVRLATGESLLMTPSLLSEIAAAAVVRTQA